MTLGSDILGLFAQAGLNQVDYMHTSYFLVLLELTSS